MHPCPQGPSTEQIRFGVVVLYPPEINRQLATLEAASARAIEPARQIIKHDCYRPPDLNALACTVEVMRFDLRPFWEVATTLEDGTQVWIVEALAAAAVWLVLAVVNPIACAPKSGSYLVGSTRCIIKCYLARVGRISPRGVRASSRERWPPPGSQPWSAAREDGLERRQ